MGEPINTQPIASKEERWKETNPLSTAVPDSTETEEQGERERQREDKALYQCHQCLFHFHSHLDCLKKIAISFPQHRNSYKLISLLIGTVINRITLPTAVFLNCLFICRAGFRKNVNCRRFASLSHNVVQTEFFRAVFLFFFMLTLVLWRLRTVDNICINGKTQYYSN